MSERKRRQARRARPAVAEVSKPLPTARPSQRSTIRVAQAQRQLAAELPSVVRVRQSAPKPSASRGVSLQSAPLSGQGEAQRSPSRAVSATRAPQPKLDKGDLHLKCRPKSNKPASGGGSGRSFVPWGNC